MNNKHTILLSDSIGALENCKKTLTKISKTCCMPERSPNMKEAQLSFDKLILVANKIESDKNNAYKCIEDIGALGGKIGYLNATCCTATREPMYQSIFKDLMAVHANMWSVLGHSH